MTPNELRHSKLALDALDRQAEWEAANGPWLPPCAACGGTGRVPATETFKIAVLLTANTEVRSMRCDMCGGTGRKERI